MTSVLPRQHKLEAYNSYISSLPASLEGSIPKHVAVFVQQGSWKIHTLISMVSGLSAELYQRGFWQPYDPPDTTPELVSIIIIIIVVVVVIVIIIVVVVVGIILTYFSRDAEHLQLLTPDLKH